MQIVRTALRWLNSVRRHWGSLVTSGAIIGTLGIWQGSGHYVRPSVYWMVGTVGLVAASYRAWSEGHDARLKLESENDLRAQQERTKAKRRQQTELLTQCIEQGQRLIQRCRSQDELVPEADASKWGTEAEKVIAVVFDSTYIPRFRSGVGIPMGAAYWPNIGNRHVDGFLYVRVYRLQCFVDDLNAK
jgi:hypothetical protein